MQIRFRIVTHPCWSPTELIKQLRKTILKTARQPKVLSWFSVRVTGHYCLHKLLKLTVWIRSVLESQLQAERHQLVVLQQEAEGLRKFLEHSDAYFLVQQQALEDFSAKQDKANQLVKLIASMVDTHGNVSWALLKLFQLCSCFAAAFICIGGQFWRPVYVICCFVPYICTSGVLWCPVDVICVIAVIAYRKLLAYLFPCCMVYLFACSQCCSFSAVC